MRRATLGMMALGLMAAFLLSVKMLSDGLSIDDDASHRRALRTSAPTPAFAGAFMPVALDAPLSSSAASGLVVTPTADGRALVGVANFYGSSTLFEIDSRRPGLAPRWQQQLNTKAAHDWTALTLPDGRMQFVVSEYDGSASIVYELNATRPRALPNWPACQDREAACASWANSGECARNRAFMHTACAAACGQCAALSGPLVAVQALAGLGGTVYTALRSRRSTQSATPSWPPDSMEL